MAALTIVSKSMNVDVNKKNHHTEKIPDLYAVRRGQSFTMSLVFNRSLQPTDSLKLSAILMDFKRAKTLLSKDVPVSDATSKTAWSARKVSTGANNAVNFEIYPPADAVIGNYSLNATVAGGKFIIGDFILLCNPWVPGDSVYISDNTQRRVYHDETFTYIYRGSTKSYSALAWDLGQWEKGILPVCLKLLENTKDVSKRNDTTQITRDLSAMVNAQDEKGVLEGNWSGEYAGGTSPSAWNGSYAILSKYGEKFVPVKYGQCWVFAGVLCTVLRCLGIPARIITNFASAHDTDGNATIERYFTFTGETYYYNDDSIWNYHCWVEAWMSRAKDLGPDYSGWQVLDATPQEVSAGRYCCGPASKRAVKEGSVDMVHDALFVFCEVNSNINFYYLDEEENVTRMNQDTASVGTLTCTMATDMKSLENITLEYKDKEGTEEERKVYARAYNIAQGFEGFRAFSAQAASAVTLPGKSPISGEIIVPDNIIVGQDINASVNLKNNADTSKMVNVTSNLKCMVYNNLNSNNIRVETQQMELGPNAAMSLPLKLPYLEFKKRLTPDRIINITVILDVKDEPTAMVEKNINLNNPSVEIKVLDQANVAKPFQVEVSFLNPLDVPVKNCVVTMEGSGLASTAAVKNIASIPANQKGVVLFELTSTKPGSYLALVNFNTDIFKDMKGSYVINVA